MGFIYKITNQVNGKVYIGKTNQTIEARFKQHRRDRFKSECLKRPLYRAFAKYGIENFSISIVEECNIDSISDREVFWIDFYNSYREGYNATIGGDGKSYLPREEIILKYLECNSARETADYFACHSDSVLYILKEANITIRRKQGEDKPETKLTKEQVSEILRLYIPKKFGKRKIAKLLNLPLEPVNSVLRGYTWKHID